MLNTIRIVFAAATTAAGAALWIERFLQVLPILSLYSFYIHKCCRVNILARCQIQLHLIRLRSFTQAINIG